MTADYFRKRMASTCAEDDCDVPPISRNLCTKHYQRRAKAGTLPPRIRADYEKTPPPKCLVEGCEEPKHGRGLCQAHLSRVRRYGLSLEDLNVLEAQAACDICTLRPPVHVDHDHDSGAVRGYLCHQCNIGLGLLGDTAADLKRAYDYLNRRTA